MKVLRGPRNPRDGGQIRCGCGAELAYTKQDVEVRDHGDTAFVVCPFCRRKISVDADDSGH